jgi:uncharacterized cupredoxin-like copper-binding protein
MRWQKRVLLGAASLLAVVLVVAACGGGDDESSGGGDGASGTVTSGTVNVTMGSPEEYSLVPEPVESADGALTFTVVNEGTIEHEMVVIKTDEGAANLATDGEADETGAVDEITLAAGESGDLEVDLEPGAYALVCNLPGHYANGMYADFTVQ